MNCQLPTRADHCFENVAWDTQISRAHFMCTSDFAYFPRLNSVFALRTFQKVSRAQSTLALLTTYESLGRDVLEICFIANIFSVFVPIPQRTRQGIHTPHSSSNTGVRERRSWQQQHLVHSSTSATQTKTQASSKPRMPW